MKGFPLAGKRENFFFHIVSEISKENSVEFFTRVCKMILAGVISRDVQVAVLCPVFL